MSLVETVVAAGILSVVLTSVAPLVIVSATRTESARRDLIAAQLARHRLTELESLTHLRTSAGIVVDGETGLAAGAFTTGGPGLSPTGLSPLQTSVDGWVDWLDERGAWVAGGTAAPPGARYRRRWGVLTGTSGDCVRVWVEVARLPALTSPLAMHAGNLHCAWGVWP